MTKAEHKKVIKAFRESLFGNREARIAALEARVLELEQYPERLAVALRDRASKTKWGKP